MNPIIPAADLEPTADGLRWARTLFVGQPDRDTVDRSQVGVHRAQIRDLTEALSRGPDWWAAQLVRDMAAVVVAADERRAELDGPLLAAVPEPKPVAA